MGQHLCIETYSKQWGCSGRFLLNFEHHHDPSFLSAYQTISKVRSFGERPLQDLLGTGSNDALPPPQEPTAKKEQNSRSHGTSSEAAVKESRAKHKKSDDMTPGHSGQNKLTHVRPRTLNNFRVLGSPEAI